MVADDVVMLLLLLKLLMLLLMLLLQLLMFQCCNVVVVVAVDVAIIDVVADVAVLHGGVVQLRGAGDPAERQVEPHPSRHGQRRPQRYPTKQRYSSISTVPLIGG